MQSLLYTWRNECDEQPDIPRLLRQRLINSVLLQSFARSINKEQYFGSLGQASLFKFASKPTVNFMIYKVLSTEKEGYLDKDHFQKRYEESHS